MKSRSHTPKKLCRFSSLDTMVLIIEIRQITKNINLLILYFSNIIFIYIVRIEVLQIGLKILVIYSNNHPNSTKKKSKKEAFACDNDSFF